MLYPALFAYLFLSRLVTGQDYCRYQSSVPLQNATDVPRRFGMVLFRGADPLDFMGPDEALFQLGRSYEIDRAFIAETLEPITSEPQLATMNKHNSSTWTQILPTHTFDTAPELDVLFVPGGGGTRSPNLNATIDFVRATFPKVQYLFTVCTGAMVAAKAGLLDGKSATTNKQAWNTVVPTGPETNWIGDARWVVDGNIWTSSGVAAGIDAMIAFLECTWGHAVTKNVTAEMEYIVHPDSHDDPFAVYPNGTYIDPNVVS
ncbi:MAG: hypothetical protein M1820_008337 [Bogoriella megaspora]|nr:MAG: hypothetical protein M1820_008337 [Bogoriella megaspora]